MRGLQLAGTVARAGLVAMLGISTGWAAMVSEVTPARAAGATAQPAGREWASFAYDPALHEVVLFGGDNGSSALGDTWVHVRRGWVGLHPAHSPSPRTGAAMVYDAATDQLLLFGGSALLGTAGGFLGGTWVWTGQDWRKLHPKTSPSARHNADLIYDAATQTVVMFGGYNGRYLGDTWTWDGVTWTQQHSAAEPSPRDTGSFAFDAATGTGVLFGGFNGSDASSDTWTWNGTWTRLNPATSPPPNTAYAWLAGYDAVTQQVLVFGHNGGQTWTWNGVTWSQQFPDSSPPARGMGSMTDDTATGHLLIFGGQSDQNNAVLGDYWAWNGVTWQRNH
jgi:hypothetical protein